jgi:Fe-S cluster biogenesis protein NfuA
MTQSSTPGTEETIRITGEFMPDPDACKFNVDREILEDWTLVFQRGEDLHGSRLPQALFEVEGICAARISGRSIVLTKDVPTPWPELAKQVVPAIRSGLGGEGPAISEAAVDAVKDAPPEEIEPMVQRLLDERINPSLASQGGWVRLHQVQDRDVHLEVGGGCQGCAASKATLKYGIENAIREAVPQVRNVVDVTDHASGENPYYT